MVYGDANQNPFGNQASLEWGGNDNDPSGNSVRLRDALNDADTERRKAQEEAMQRERAAEIRREERLKKIAYMEDMPDSTPAGTGTYMHGYADFSYFVGLGLTFPASHIVIQSRNSCSRKVCKISSISLTAN